MILMRALRLVRFSIGGTCAVALYKNLLAGRFLYGTPRKPLRIMKKTGLSSPVSLHGFTCVGCGTMVPVSRFTWQSNNSRRCRAVGFISVTSSFDMCGYAVVNAGGADGQWTIHPLA